MALSDAELKVLGEYVVWLEANASNFHQSLAQSLITSAPLWDASRQEFLAKEKANAPVS